MSTSLQSIEAWLADEKHGFTAVSQSDYASFVAHRLDWHANRILERLLKTFPGDFAAAASFFTAPEWQQMADLKVEGITHLASGSFAVPHSLCTHSYQAPEDYQVVIKKFNSLPKTQACAAFCILSVVGRFVSSSYWSNDQPWWQPSWLLDQLPILPMRDEVHQPVFSFEEPFVDVPL
ncbi:hypothetical protein [Actomonas aquatica]|uniref:Uncharacterized protein n=1 Tax=Actomonas aquatica TaxID=2866162 RepID=A0ABZ1C9A8_9BACT|nr:hypothetical protein [Opitutus sp. WL0086]WRQ88051.1 hypothetical protein K1X11_001445 [Opitutus sp. WL0086]